MKKYTWIYDGSVDEFFMSLNYRADERKWHHFFGKFGSKDYLYKRKSDNRFVIEKRSYSRNRLSFESLHGNINENSTNIKITATLRNTFDAYFIFIFLVISMIYVINENHYYYMFIIPIFIIICCSFIIYNRFFNKNNKLIYLMNKICGKAAKINE